MKRAFYGDTPDPASQAELCRGHSMITKLSDVPGIVRQTVADPESSFPAIMKLASSDDWKEREVAASLFGRGEIFLLRVGRKRAVGNALGIKLPVAEAKEFSVHADARLMGGGRGHQLKRGSRTVSSSRR